MKKIAYFDCFSGISGDMILGAMVDAGLPLIFLNRTLSSLIPGEIKFRARKTNQGGFQATKVDVIPRAGINRPFKNLNSILKVIQKSPLSPSVKSSSRLVFQRLAEGEGKSHGTSPENVSFEELGGFDTIADIVGAVSGLDFLKIEEIYSSEINVGGGIIQMHHGKFPAPGPATVHLLKNIPIYSSGVKKELTTPTGAAIISTLADSFGSLPLFKIQKTGLGAGNFVIKESPNLLRLMVGESEGILSQDRIYRIETQIDDMNPQIYDTLIEHLLKEGALDATLTPLIMKKGRPAILLTVLSPLDGLPRLSDILFQETTTLGLRVEKVSRFVLKREGGRFRSSWGWIRIKKSFLGKDVRIVPEYEDCRMISEKFQKPLKDVLAQIGAEILRHPRRKVKP